jgi:hypothetical protein
MNKLLFLTLGMFFAAQPLATTAHAAENVAASTSTEVSTSGPVASTSDLWQEVTSLRGQTEQALKDNNLKGIHDLTNRLNVTLGSLKSSLTNLDAARRLRAEAAIGQAVKATSDLHAVADSNSSEAVAEAAARQGNALKLISVYIPQ